MSSPWQMAEEFLEPPDPEREHRIAAARDVVLRVWPWLKETEVNQIADIVIEAYEKR